MLKRAQISMTEKFRIKLIIYTLRFIFLHIEGVTCYDVSKRITLRNDILLYSLMQNKAINTNEVVTRPNLSFVSTG